MAGRLIVCGHCGIQFEQTGRGRPRKYCSKRCLWTGRDRLAGVRPIAEVRRERRLAALRICKHCEAEFLPRNGSNKWECCSRTCADAARNRSAYLGIARELAGWANPNRMLGYRSRINVLRLRVARKQTACLGCGAHIEQASSGLRRYCSKKCRPVDAELKAKHKRTAKAKRRARKRGADCETVDPFKVFERDGWRCHLCGCKTDRSKRGTPHPKAPELDHIVPLSKGGPHNYGNTACACRKCNYTKGGRVIGQPSLLAA